MDNARNLDEKIQWSFNPFTRTDFVIDRYGQFYEHNTVLDTGAKVLKRFLMFKSS